jgi:predicted nucleic acid-binding protein
MIAVADAGPLLYLVLIEEVEILRALYGRVLTPPAVVKELTHPRTPEIVSGWITEPPHWLRVRVPLRTFGEFPSTLGAGEREAIALAEEVRAEVLLIDDGAGRREARSRKMAITGTLGILGLAARHGLTDLQPAIERLRATNFRATEELIESVFDEDAKTRRDNLMC